VGYLIDHCSGFICASLPPKRLSNLALPPLLPLSGTSQDPKGTAYHLTVDASSVKSHPVTTGISAHDRAYTARLLASSTTSEDDLTRPGHMVTLRYTPGGVRRRRGHTECAVGESGLWSLVMSNADLFRFVLFGGIGTSGIAL
jgi:3,4-dihydroxy-2-butanone 4-phosphate synthase